MRSLLLVFIIASGLIVSGCRKDKIEKDDNVEPADFLSSDDFEKLVVEVQYVSGYAPSSTTINNLRTFLEQRLNKPGGVSISQNVISSPGKPVLSIDDIRNIEEENRTQHTNRKTLTAYFFFADAEYAENSGSSKVLGIAYGKSSMVIFQKTIQDYSGGLSQPARPVLESTVVLHEFGHILGLVNNGTPMTTEHQDEANGRHCDNSNCLMYYLAETSDIVGNLLGGSIPSLDAKCISDLRANGGK